MSSAIVALSHLDSFELDGPPRLLLEGVRPAVKVIAATTEQLDLIVDVPFGDARLAAGQATRVGFALASPVGSGAQVGRPGRIVLRGTIVTAPVRHRGRAAIRLRIDRVYASKADEGRLEEFVAAYLGADALRPGELVHANRRVVWRPRRTPSGFVPRPGGYACRLKAELAPDDFGPQPVAGGIVYKVQPDRLHVVTRACHPLEGDVLRVLIALPDEPGEPGLLAVRGKVLTVMQANDGAVGMSMDVTQGHGWNRLLHRLDASD